MTRYTCGNKHDNPTYIQLKTTNEGDIEICQQCFQESYIKSRNDACREDGVDVEECTFIQTGEKL